MSRRAIAGIQVLVLVLGVAVWELLTRVGVVNPFLLAPPSAIASTAAGWFASGQIWHHLADTLVTLLAGYLAGVVLGMAMGMLSGRNYFIRCYLDVFLVFLNSIPRLVLIPFFIIIFGFGRTPGIIVTGLIVVFLVAFNTRAAVDEIGADYVLNARVLGADGWQLTTTVYLPGVALSVVSSARVAVGLGFQAAVVAQFFGSPSGLGFLIAQGQQSYNPAQIYAGIALTSLLAYAFDLLLGLVGRRASRWLPGNR